MRLSPRPNKDEKPGYLNRNIRRCSACWVEVNSTEKVCHLCGACLCVSPDPKSDDRYTTCKTCGGKITRSKVEQRVGRERLMRDE